MHPHLATVVVLAAGVAAVSAVLVPARAQSAAWTASLDEIRAVAARDDGRRALRINVLKFAESRRTRNFSVQGAPADPSVQARTAFQVVYADGHVMVDAGMDQEVHRFFGRGVDEPYDAIAARQVEDALVRAKLIVFTHEHGDHVGGLLRSARATELASKAILTVEQERTLRTSPQMPEIRLTPEMAARHRIVDYNHYLPLAPGMALVKAPGHTPGSQMIYVVLESGREYLLIGDVAWHMDGVRQIRGKDAPWVTEDRDAVAAQLRWLNELSRVEPRLVIVASHDAEQHAELIRQGLLGGRFE